VLHPRGCSWGAFEHGLGKTWSGWPGKEPSFTQQGHGCLQKALPLPPACLCSAASVEIPREPGSGMREDLGAAGGRAGVRANGRRCAGDGSPWCGAGTRFLGGTVPAVALPVWEGGRKVVGRGDWVRASGGDGFSAAGLSPLVFFPELAGLELLVCLGLRL